jgi:hypothetical protein
MSREAFEKWFLDTQGYEPFNKSLNQESEERAMQSAWEAWQAALQSGEPVARVIDDGTPEGATEWIPFYNRIAPLKTGDLLYTTSQPVAPEGYVLVPVEPTEAMLMAWFSATRESSEGVGTLGYFRAAYKALLSAGKETV